MNEWQLIKTVPVLPDSGFECIIYSPEVGSRHAIAYPDGSYHDPVYQEWFGKNATHWMLLPPPPQS